MGRWVTYQLPISSSLGLDQYGIVMNQLKCELVYVNFQSRESGELRFAAASTNDHDRLEGGGVFLFQVYNFNPQIKSIDNKLGSRFYIVCFVYK